MIELRGGIEQDLDAKTVKDDDEEALAQFEEYEAFVQRLQTGRITLVGIPGMPNATGPVNVTAGIETACWDYDKATRSISVVILFPIVVSRGTQTQTSCTLTFQQKEWQSILTGETRQRRRFFHGRKLIATLNIPPL